MARTMPDWEPLESAMEGDVALLGTPAYEASRRPFNALFHDVWPMAIVACATPQDVSEVISFARRHGLDVAMRSGGHSFAGHSTTRGIVLDVTPLRSVSVSGGVATVGAGTRLGEVYEALQEHGLAIPAGTCPDVGVAGLTLGGGLGILGRKYGATCDSLVGAEIVLADGRILTCDEHHETDLFWALRGAGAGNFGVVTSLAFRTVPAPEATNVHLAWPFSRAADVIAAGSHGRRTDPTSSLRA
jgi:FAD/FMN-containing dehydrogenase